MNTDIITVAPHQDVVLSADALSFIATLQRQFNSKRLELLELRKARQKRLNAGEIFDFLAATEKVRRDKTWKIAAAPQDLQDRKVEITGPVERKMMINAFNSGANVFMADFEDSLSPTWPNVIEGQFNLIEAVAGTLAFISPEGKSYALRPPIATLMVRPRGWHLVEKHLLIDHQPMSASLFDFGLFFFHNAKKLIQKGSGPYFYLPKMESHLEAKLWNDVFIYAQKALGIPEGTIRATVLIETLPAAYEMEEILYELRLHSAGLNAGRWDYIFSTIKKFQHRDLLFPDRSQIAMTVPFMRAYTELLVKTCHARGAHAMGGMAAFIPSRKDPEVNANALKKVREDKLRESNDGFDGTWVAHPDLVSIAKEIFTEVLGSAPNQVTRQREDVHIQAKDLVAFTIADGIITEKGFRHNINVALQYISSWLNGVGAVALYNLMEDAATAEISRAQLWQWVHNSKAKFEKGDTITKDLYKKVAEEEFQTLQKSGVQKLETAKELLDHLVLNDAFTEFLTLPAYEKL